MLFAWVYSLAQFSFLYFLRAHQTSNRQTFENLFVPELSVVQLSGPPPLLYDIASVCWQGKPSFCEYFSQRTVCSEANLAPLQEGEKRRKICWMQNIKTTNFPLSHCLSLCLMTFRCFFRFFSTPICPPILLNTSLFSSSSVSCFLHYSLLFLLFHFSSLFAFFSNSNASVLCITSSITTCRRLKEKCSIAADISKFKNWNSSHTENSLLRLIDKISPKFVETANPREILFKAFGAIMNNSDHLSWLWPNAADISSHSLEIWADWGPVFASISNHIRQQWKFNSKIYIAGFSVSKQNNA